MLTRGNSKQLPSWKKKSSIGWIGGKAWVLNKQPWPTHATLPLDAALCLVPTNGQLMKKFRMNSFQQGRNVTLMTDRDNDYAQGSDENDTDSNVDTHVSPQGEAYTIGSPAMASLYTTRWAIWVCNILFLWASNMWKMTRVQDLVTRSLIIALQVWWLVIVLHVVLPGVALQCRLLAKIEGQMPSSSSVRTPSVYGRWVSSS